MLMRWLGPIEIGLLKMTWDSLRFRMFVRFVIWAFCMFMVAWAWLRLERRAWAVALAWARLWVRFRIWLWAWAMVRLAWVK